MYVIFILFSNLVNDMKLDTLSNVMSSSLSSLDGELTSTVQDDSNNSENASFDTFSTTHCNSFLCMAIRDPDDKVLGVISLIDKEPGEGVSVLGHAPLSPTSPLGGGGYFTENDEQFVKAFSIFCGMAIR